ncbi:MAG: LysM peptidoglycan-binding domain-containing protein, partial [Paramuribaculum sp.]|nr:LysM peptidoglycan-binding domain-containing protein [Paramuribaculum sp.]
VSADSTSVASADGIIPKPQDGGEQPAVAQAQPKAAAAESRTSSAAKTSAKQPASKKSAAKAASAAASTTTYTVRRGDNLSKIAKRFGTTVAAIQKANGMSGTRLDIGDKLKIPARR